MSSFSVADYSGRVIDEKFTLGRRLGGTAHSSVFLTELAGEPSRQAAIKFVAADDGRSAQWEAAASLSHPDLIRVFAFGQCERDGESFAYISTEYADEVLAQILEHRPLTAEEAAQMLPPVLDGLEYLHEQGLVHGSLTPANVLACGERLKLSVDEIEAAGEPASPFHPSSKYDAPEMATENLAPSTDVWSLGVLLAEALTGQRPLWNQAGGEEPVVAASMPEPFASIARNCLRTDPAQRCTLAEIRACLELAPDVQPVLAPVPVAASVPVAIPAAAPLPPTQTARKTQSRIPAAIAVLGVLIALVVIAAVVMRSHRTPTPPAEAAAQSSVSAPAGSPSNGAVIHKVMPDVPQAAMATIRGHVRVEIRVEVDAHGNVSNATIESQGPSRYFAQYALNAARGWKFRPAAPSTWMLQFVFAQDGVEATPVEARR